MKSLIILPLLIWTQVRAQDFNQEKYCKMMDNTPEKKVRLPAAPSWFIDVHPDGNTAAVIMSGLDGNNLVSLNETDEHGNPKITPVPGGVDPVYTPDGWFITEPGSFYDLDQIKQNEKNKLPTKEMENAGSVPVQSVYQSIGMTKKEKDKHTYMYIADPNPVREGNLQYAIVEGSIDKTSKKKSVKTIKTGNLCGNVENFNAHTPMISRDGKYLSVINDATNTTQIFRVGADGADCKMVADLGVPTGKVSFDFSETTPRKLAFHVDRYETNIEWFQKPGSNLSKDSYVMTLDVEGSGDNEVWKPTQIQKLSHNPEKNSGVYYPRFTEDGKIVAVNATAGGDYFLEKFDPEKGSDFQYNSLAFSNLNEENFVCDYNKFQDLKAIYGIASLYSRICDKFLGSTRMKDAILIQPFLDHDSCRNLITDYWENSKEHLSAHNSGAKGIDESVFDLSWEDLIALCPEQKNKTEITTAVINSEVREETPEDAFKSVCSGCHLPTHPSGGFMFIDASGKINTKSSAGFTGLNATSAERALNTILNPQSMNVMPPPAQNGNSGYQMDDARKKKVVEYLINFLPPAKQSVYSDKLNRHLSH